MFFQVHEITHFYSDKTSFLKFIFCLTSPRLLFKLSTLNYTLYLGVPAIAVGLSAISLLAPFPSRLPNINSALRQAQ